MRVTNGHVCKDCIYFDPDMEVCQFDNEYKNVSEFHQACFSFATDDDDIMNSKPDYSISSLYDGEDDNDFYDDY